MKTYSKEEKLIREYVQAALREKQPSEEAVDHVDILRDLEAVAASLAARVEALDATDSRVDESLLVTAYGTIISASGLAKILGYTAKGIAMALRKLGVKSVDPEQEGKTFFEIGDKIHHLYLGALKGLASKMGVPPEKRSLAANIMFGVLLGSAMTMTGIELFSAIKGSKLAMALGESGMAGVKIGEGAETGANILTLIREAFETVPELAGTVIDAAETAGEVEQAAELGGIV